MSATHMSGPLFVGGVQIGIQSPANVRGQLPGGKAFYVCNRTGVSAGNGKSPNQPFETLAEALTALGGRQNFGDCIYILPGHVESVNAADWASATGAAAGFSIVGIGTGSQKPAFNWTAATATWLIDTANVELANLALNMCGIVAATTITVATPMTVSAAGFRMINCDVNWGLDTNTGCGSTLGAIALVAATKATFIGNRFINLDTAGTLAVSCISVDGGSELVVVGNIFKGGTTSTTVGAVHFVTTASLNVQVVGNYIENTRASSTKALTSAIAGVTGEFSYNRLFVNSGIVGVTTSNIPPVYQNFTADTVAQNGALDVGAGTST